MKLVGHPLEHHPDRIRIQKLLYFVYSQVWITDVKALEGVSIQQLLDNLWAQSPSVEQLQRRLLDNAERLNKSETYLRLAHLILESIPQHHPTAAASPQKVSDRFQLRYSIMQVMNPLKAKALLMALYNAQTSSPQTQISNLTSFSLDELVRKVMQIYPSIPELGRAFDRLRSLPPEIEAGEREQLIQTLFEALRPYLAEQALPPATVTSDFEDPEFAEESLCTILISSKSAVQSSPSL